jgi:predicted transposase/invertase (TIGR01784 family)
MSPPINNPHDKFFKEIFSQLEVIWSFIKTYLEERIGFKLDLYQLQASQNGRVNTLLQEFLSDLVFYTETIPENKPLYLIFEHKSYQDQDISIQIDNYIRTIRDSHIHLKSGKTEIPLILPVIIYHGENRWDIGSVLPSPKTSQKNTARFTQNFSYEYFDFSHIPDNQIRGNALLRIALLTMKYIQSPELMTKLDGILVIFEEMAKERNIALELNAFSLYIENAAIKDLRQKLLDKIVIWKNGGTKMSEVSKVFQKLKNEGRVEGKIEDAINMFKKGLSKELVHEITGIPMDQIIEFEKRVNDKKCEN